MNVYFTTKMTKIKKLTVLGAGCGDPDLLTLKGLKALQSADVVLYDALANDALLQYVPPQAVKIFVGKRRGYKAYSQEDINEMIVEYAENCGHVIRLKGGDPFVFGRGREEMLYAETNGIETEYIAGISSAIAAPAALGIPVTFRAESRSFWVITATTETGELSQDIKEAAKLNATVIILMGLGQLQEIINIYFQENQPNKSIAIVQNATLPTQKSVIGTMQNIKEKVEIANLKPPAVIIIGEVVRLAKDFQNV